MMYTKYVSNIFIFSSKIGIVHKNLILDKIFPSHLLISDINKNYPNHFIIADAKRGDIGNTSGRYAKAFFENFGVDAVTISPYMGRDSIEPFLSYKDKYAVLFLDLDEFSLLLLFLV